MNAFRSLFGTFLNLRGKYNTAVANLLPAFGFTVEDAGSRKIINALDIAWKKKFNEYEAAYYVAVLVLSGMTKAGEFKRAQTVSERLMYVSTDWLSRGGLISEQFVMNIQPTVDEIIRNFPKEPMPEFEFSPNMPDVMKAEEICSYNSDKYYFLLSKDVVSIGESTTGVELPLKYPLVMTAVDKTTKKPRSFVTLETGFTQGIHLCSFEPPDIHNNFGDASSLVGDDAFESVAFDIICKTLNIDKGSISKVSNN